MTGSIYSNHQGTTGGGATVEAYEAWSPRIEGVFPESNDEIDIFSLTVEYDFEWASFESLTSFTDRKVHSITEFPYSWRDGLDSTTEIRLQPVGVGTRGGGVSVAGFLCAAVALCSAVRSVRGRACGRWGWGAWRPATTTSPST